MVLLIDMSQIADCCHSVGDFERGIRLEEQVVEILRQNQPDSRGDLCACEYVRKHFNIEY